MVVGALVLCICIWLASSHLQHVGLYCNDFVLIAIHNLSLQKTVSPCVAE